MFKNRVAEVKWFSLEGNLPSGAPIKILFKVNGASPDDTAFSVFVNYARVADDLVSVTMLRNLGITDVVKVSSDTEMLIDGSIDFHSCDFVLLMGEYWGQITHAILESKKWNFGIVMQDYVGPKDDGEITRALIRCARDSEGLLCFSDKVLSSVKHVSFSQVSRVM